MLLPVLLGTHNTRGWLTRHYMCNNILLPVLLGAHKTRGWLTTVNNKFTNHYSGRYAFKEGGPEQANKLKKTKLCTYCRTVRRLNKTKNKNRKRTYTKECAKLLDSSRYHPAVNVYIPRWFSSLPRRPKPAVAPRPRSRSRRSLQCLPSSSKPVRPETKK